MAKGTRVSALRQAKINNAQAKANTTQVKTLNGFLSAFDSRMQKARVEKTLSATRNIGGVVTTDARFIENAVKNNLEIKNNVEVSKQLTKLTNGSKQAQFTFLKNQGYVKENQYGDFVRGKELSTNATGKGVIDYLRTKNTDSLSNTPYVKSKYRVYNKDGSFIEVSKIAYDYAQYLKKKW